MLVTIAVVVATLFEVIPTFLIRSNVPTISTVTPYTPLELAGRDIYVAEGCYNCHSQMIRPMIAETKRYGAYSKPGEFIYDHPFQWGSRRIGPDMAREGGRQSSLWQWRHLENPESLSPGSVMPAFAHLLRQEIDFKKTSDRVWAASMLGAKYGDELTNAPEIAKKQAQEIAADIVSQGGPITVRLPGKELPISDTKAVALIAYLQRLGVDAFKVPAAPEAQPAAAPESETPATANTDPADESADKSANVGSVDVVSTVASISR